METKLKVKLEDIVLLGESITKLAPEVYGLHRKIVDGQEPKTPTEEQIENIDKVWGNTFGSEWDITPIEDLIKVTIAEWEKIRNMDARVEKKCKNNLGTKDWLDFYNAINSLK